MLIEKGEEEAVMEPVPPLSQQLRLEPAQEEEKRLVSPSTAAISAAALSELARIARERNLILGHGDVTLEALGREALRPLLKAWFDEHLPAMIERIVAKEIERLAYQAESDKW